MRYLLFCIIFSSLLFSDIIKDNNVDGLYYLNEIRSKSGLNTFKTNSILEKSAKNHTNYLIYNKFVSHNEKPLTKGFTGFTPSERAIKMGYNTSFVGENLTAGIFGYTKSIEQLMTAIYHRLAFLNFNYNEVGMYGNKNIVVFNMGNSDINYHCSTKESYKIKYKTDICKSKRKISSYEYESMHNVEKRNPDVVVFPSTNSINNMTSFYDETPDPLPDKIVSGNPISIHFNPSKTKKIKMEYFKIFDGYKEIKNTRILTSKNDPNNIIDEFSFVLFPLDRLKWGHTYTIKFKGEKDGFPFYKEWMFHTKSLNGPVIDITNNKRKLWKNTNYNIYFPPKYFGKLQSFRSNCSNLEIIDYNTILINSKASCFIQTERKTINLNLY